MAEIGVICGMVSEVRSLGSWADDPRVLVAVSGARPARAEELAQEFADRDVRLLLSWGIAGGLDPALATGDLLIASDVVMLDDERRALAVPDQHPGRAGVFAGADEVIATVQEKLALRARTGAVAVDMETHRLANIAYAAGIPCCAVRAISDPADRALPALAAGALGPDGRPMLGHVIRGLVRRPFELPGLLAAGRDSNKALATLRAAVDPVFSQLLKG